MTILPQLEEDLMRAAAERLAAPAPVTARSRRRTGAGWRGGLVPAAAALIAVAVVGVALGLLRPSSASRPTPVGPTAPRPGAGARVEQLLAGVPQSGRRLGSPRAPVSIVLVADLRSPISARLVAGVLPGLIEGPVRTGVASLTFRGLCTSSCPTPGVTPLFAREQSALLSAGRQHRLWNYALLALARLPSLPPGRVTRERLTQIARAIPGLNVARWQADKRPELIKQGVTDDPRFSAHHQVTSTPTLLFVGRHGAHRRLIGLVGIGQIRQTIELLRRAGAPAASAGRQSRRSSRPRR